MKTKIPLIPRSVAATLLTGLLCWLPASNQQAQIIIFGGGSTTTSGSGSFQGQASAVSGFALGSAVSVADTGPLAVSGGAQEASALEMSVASGLAVGRDRFVRRPGFDGGVPRSPRAGGPLPDRLAGIGPGRAAGAVAVHRRAGESAGDR